MLSDLLCTLTNAAHTSCPLAPLKLNMFASCSHVINSTRLTGYLASNGLDPFTQLLHIHNENLAFHHIPWVHCGHK